MAPMGQQQMAPMMAPPQQMAPVGYAQPVNPQYAAPPPGQLPPPPAQQYYPAPPQPQYAAPEGEVGCEDPKSTKCLFCCPVVCGFKFLGVMAALTVVLYLILIAIFSLLKEALELARKDAYKNGERDLE